MLWGGGGGGGDRDLAKNTEFLFHMYSFKIFRTFLGHFHFFFSPGLFKTWKFIFSFSRFSEFSKVRGNLNEQEVKRRCARLSILDKELDSFLHDTSLQPFDHREVVILKTTSDVQ